VPEKTKDRRLLRSVLSQHGHAVEPQENRLVVDIDGADPLTVAAAVNRAAFDAGIVLAELTPLRTSLEDRYLALVNEGGDR